MSTAKATTSGGGHRGAWFCRPARPTMRPLSSHTRVQHFFLPQRYRDPFGRTRRRAMTPTICCIQEATDAWATRSPPASAIRQETCRPSGNDYRVLQPRAGDRPERQSQRRELRRAGHGRRHGRHGQARTERRADGDLLGRFRARSARRRGRQHIWPIRSPTRRRSSGTRRPGWSTTRSPTRARRRRPTRRRAVVYTLVRETHDADLGAERADQDPASAFPTPTDSAARSRRRSQAEPGPVADGGPIVERRWVAAAGRSSTTRASRSGSTSRSSRRRTHFEFDVRVGVSPDPVLRSRWAASSPRSTRTTPGRRSCSIRGGRRAGTSTTRRSSPIPAPIPTSAISSAVWPSTDYLPTWLRAAAVGRQLDAAGAGRGRQRPRFTPPRRSIAHADTLGRTFLTIAQNKFVRERHNDRGDVRHRVSSSTSKATSAP